VAHAAQGRAEAASDRFKDDVHMLGPPESKPSISMIVPTSAIPVMPITICEERENAEDERVWNARRSVGDRRDRALRELRRRRQ
jgi:hypothetical protein